MTSTQVSEAKKVAHETANALPPYIKDMKMSSSAMACQYGPEGMACSRDSGHNISCRRKGPNEVTCMVDGLKFKCHRKNKDWTCNIRRM
jgi:hypothetical protein